MAGIKMKESHEWRLLGDVMMTFTVPGDISDELYVNQFLRDLRASNARMIFSVAAGSNPVSPTQRKAAAEVMKEKAMAAVVITDSRLTRGVLTAVSWLGAKVNGYPWAQLEDAVAGTGADPKVQAEIVKFATEFRDNFAKKIDG